MLAAAHWGLSAWLTVKPTVQTCAVGPCTVEVRLDTAEVTPVTERDDPRTPSDLADVLRNAEMLDDFEVMSPSHRREYIEWIDEATRDETRRRRITGTVERLRDS